jgi:hypothetical protein
MLTGNVTTGVVGFPVASAGDVNGDGYADALLGNLDTPSGKALVFYGNAASGLDRSIRQMRTDGTTPIALLGESDSQTAFHLRERGVTPAGRGKIRLQWEAKPLGSPFNGTGGGTSTVVDTGAPGAGGSAASFNESIALPGVGYYHWRSRISSNNPFFPHSPWMSLADNNLTETKLRTGGGCSDLDGDGYGYPGDLACAASPGDCNDSDATVWGTPGEVLNLVFTNSTTLTWSPPSDPGGSVPSLIYDTLFSTTASNFTAAATCLESDDGPNTTATDAATPPPGIVYFYLSRAQNSCAFGTGSLGTDSFGVPREGRSCP